MNLKNYFKFSLVVLMLYTTILSSGCVGNKYHIKYYNKSSDDVKNAIEKSMENLKMIKLSQKEQNVLEYKMPGVVAKISFKIEEKENITRVKIMEPPWQTEYRESAYISAFQQELFGYKKSVENIRRKDYRKGTLLDLCSLGFVFPYISHDNPLYSADDIQVVYRFSLPLIIFFVDTYLPLTNIYKGIKIEESVAFFLGYRIMGLFAVRTSVKQYNALMGAGYDYDIDFSDKYLSPIGSQHVELDRQEMKKVDKKDEEVNEQEKRRLVTFAPIGLLFDSLYINYETRLDEKGSIRLNLGYYNITKGEVSSKGRGYWNMNCLNTGFTYYILPRKKLEGLCIGPRLDIYIVDYKYTDYDYNLSKILFSETGVKVFYGIGVETIIRRQLFDSEFVIELGGVGLYRIGNELVSSNGAIPPKIPDISEYKAILNIGHPF